MPVDFVNERASAVRPQDEPRPLVPQRDGVPLHKQPHADGVASARSDVGQVFLQSDVAMGLDEETLVSSQPRPAVFMHFLQHQAISLLYLLHHYYMVCQKSVSQVV